MPLKINLPSQQNKKMKKILKIIKTEWNAKNILVRTNLVLACMALLVCLGYAGATVKGKLDKTVNTRISLTYQEAANGLNPNGTRFNPYFIISEEVLKKAEEKLGYEINTSNIWISFPSTTNKTSYTTDFYINYNGDHDGTEVLQAVASSWAQLFEEKYTYNNSSVIYNEPSEDTDYIYLVTWLSNEASEISSYAKKRMKENNTWNDDGTTFRTIYDSAQNLIDVEIENFKTFIVQNGVSKDASSLINSMAYKDRLLSDKKQNFEAQYQNRRDAITLYDPTLFPTISVPSISSGTYYITTTKTGLDYIYDAAASASSSSLATQRMIREDELLVANMSNDSSDTANLEVANQMYEKLKDSIQSLGEKLQDLDVKYNSQQLEPYYRIVVDGEEYAVE